VRVIRTVCCFYHSFGSVRCRRHHRSSRQGITKWQDQRLAGHSNCCGPAAFRTEQWHCRIPGNTVATCERCRTVSLANTVSNVRFIRQHCSPGYCGINPKSSSHPSRNRSHRTATLHAEIGEETVVLVQMGSVYPSLFFSSFIYCLLFFFSFLLPLLLAFSE
jgi:hypothetical protein